jgi:hypothetical protein
MPFELVKTLLVSVLVGIVLILCASSNVYTYYEFDSTLGQITNIEQDKNKVNQLTISYTANGNTHTGVLTANSPDNKVGDTIPVDYNKNNVSDVRLSANHLKSALFSSVAGIVCMFIFYLAFIRIKKDVEKISQL